MGEEDKMYNMVCKEKFDDLKIDTQKILKILTGNGAPGLIDDVRDNTKFRKSITEDTKWFKRIVIGAIVIQVVSLAFIFIKGG